MEWTHSPLFCLNAISNLICHMQIALMLVEGVTGTQCSVIFSADKWGIVLSLGVIFEGGLQVSVSNFSFQVLLCELQGANSHTFTVPWTVLITQTLSWVLDAWYQIPQRQILSMDFSFLWEQAPEQKNPITPDISPTAKFHCRSISGNSKLAS